MVRISREHQREVATALGVAVGDVLGEQFRVDALRGRGGMGEVYEGFDLALERPVAIKVLPGFLLESKRAARALKQEALRAIELTHECLGRVHHFGVHEGQPYMIMELVRGRSLNQILDERELLPLDETLELLAGLAAGLDHAHRKRVVHRDIKPSNIMVREHEGTPVLIDFGISAEARDQTTRMHPEPDETLGTLSYMSPEQVRGRRPQPAMDVYSLGATVYEMLAGHPPFFRGDPLSVRMQILEEEPEEVPGLPAGAQAVLRRCLAKRPGERFPSAGAFHAALQAAAPGGLARAETRVDLPSAAAETVVEPGSGEGQPSARAETVVDHEPPAPAAPTLAAAETVVDQEPPAPGETPASAAETVVDPSQPTKRVWKPMSYTKQDWEDETPTRPGGFRPDWENSGRDPGETSGEGTGDSSEAGTGDYREPFTEEELRQFAELEAIAAREFGEPAPDSVPESGPVPESEPDSGEGEGLPSTPSRDGDPEILQIDAEGVARRGSRGEELSPEVHAEGARSPGPGGRMRLALGLGAAGGLGALGCLLAIIGGMDLAGSVVFGSHLPDNELDLFFGALWCLCFGLLPWAFLRLGLPPVLRKLGVSRDSVPADQARQGLPMLAFVGALLVRWEFTQELAPYLSEYLALAAACWLGASRAWQTLERPAAPGTGEVLAALFLVLGVLDRAWFFLLWSSPLGDIAKELGRTQSAAEGTVLACLFLVAFLPQRVALVLGLRSWVQPFQHRMLRGLTSLSLLSPALLEFLAFERDRVGFWIGGPTGLVLVGAATAWALGWVLPGVSEPPRRPA